MSRPASEHGTLRSYVVGFVLSLASTLVPYFLVVSHTVSGTALLTVILGFAFVQMLIQITFFLHIGRGPKPKWNLFFFAATAGIILVIVGGSILIINNLHYNMAPPDATKKLVNGEGIYQVSGQPTGACQQLGPNHEVIIKDSQVKPLHTAAKKCDTLTFINKDSHARVMAFGSHPAHQAYAGEIDLKISKGYNKTITLSDSGSYQFHDHLQDEVTGYFTVEP